MTPDQSWSGVISIDLVVAELALALLASTLPEQVEQPEH